MEKERKRIAQEEVDWTCRSGRKKRKVEKKIFCTLRYHHKDKAIVVNVLSGCNVAGTAGG